MNIVKLERMIAVYEAGSFRKAAKRFGMSQPALTWSIRQLEESLGVALFDRGPSGIRATAACETLIVRARLIVNEHDRLLAEAERNNRTQVIAVGVHAMLLDSRFARIIGAYRECEPEVTLRVTEAYSADLINQLRRGELDLAISAAPPAGDEAEEIAFEPLLRQHYSIFAPPGHAIFAAIKGGGPIPEQAWIQADAPNLAIRHKDPDRVFELLSRFGMTESSVAIRSASMQFIRRMVVDGGMLGMVPVSQFANELRDGTVRRVPDSDVEGPPLGLLWIEGCYENAARRRLKSSLRILKGQEAPESAPAR
jgi:DNA-binding transcriptional LysR family regulator